jgi:hypothetical protein
MGGLWPSLVINAVAPFVLYQVLLSHHVKTAPALAATAIFPVLGVLLGWARTRRLDIIGVVSLVLIVLGLLTTLITGNAKVLLLRGSVITGGIGVACLLSLLLPRPAMFYVGRYFASGGNRAVASRFDSLWQYPSFRSVQRLITVVWGIAFLAEALIRVALVQTVSTSRVLAISPVLTTVVTVLVLAWTFSYVRRTSAQGEALRMASLARLGTDSTGGPSA